jgi:hypothetical protein
LNVLRASFNSILANKERDELYRIYLNCLETGVEFRATAVPRDLPVATGSLSLNAADQKTLYEVGYEIGLTAGQGEEWRDLPPGSNPQEQALPRAGTHFETGKRDPGSARDDQRSPEVAPPGGTVAPAPR